MFYSPPTYALITWSLLALATCDGLPKNTYWVDVTCTQRPHWNEYMNDAFNMAQVSSRRLFNAAQFRKSDTDYANVFERIFHTRISDQNAYDRVQGMRMSSNTRFPELTVWTGVVGDRRWTKLGDGHYIDEDNLMLDNEPGACTIRRALGYMTRQTTLKPDKNSPSYINAKTEPRAVITLCEAVFDDYYDPVINFDAPKKLSDIPATVNLGGLGIENFGLMVSVTILHEVELCYSYCPGNGYGWENIMAMRSEYSLDNADSHAYMMLWGGLAERGYTLPRRLNAEGSVDGINAMRANQGILALYRDITR
ncbi:hypothetical protein MFRU_028g00480 [Monilinia fructicola]|nr:hypothetical protein MFRU_028g00480 [Monilinia fructicola]